MPEKPDPSSTPRSSPPPSIRWRSWPLGESVVRSALLIGGLLAAALAIYLFSRQITLAALALAVLAGAFWRFFLPVEFQLSEKGVDQWYLGRRRHIPWGKIRHHEVCAAGVLLLPDEVRSTLSAFRGLYLPFGIHRDAVLPFVRQYLERADRGQRLAASQ